jgi:chemotaxis protein MotB
MSGTPIIIVKKKVKGHGAHGAAWKVAYADFVTAMMALFMVLWLLSQTDQESRRVVSEYFRTGVFSGSSSLLEGGTGAADKGFVDVNKPFPKLALEDNVRKVRAELQRIMTRDPNMSKIHKTVRVTATPAGLLIEFIDSNEDLLFDLNSSELKPALARTLAALAPVLVSTGYRIRIQGHTDARPFPTGSTRNNWVLSFERADKARVILTEAGFPEGDVVGVFAHGSSAPLDEGDPKAPSNRRLSLLAIPRERGNDTGEVSGVQKPIDGVVLPTSGATGPESTNVPPP